MVEEQYYKINIDHEPLGIKNGVDLRKLYNKLREKYCIESFTRLEGEKVLGVYKSSFDELLKNKYIIKVNKPQRIHHYIPTLSNDGHHISTYVLRDKVTGRFVSMKDGK